jgi:hypothetical protein
VLAKAGPGIRFNEHIEGDGPTVFALACKLGLEGIVSKRKDSLSLLKNNVMAIGRGASRNIQALP